MHALNHWTYKLVVFYFPRRLSLPACISTDVAPCPLSVQAESIITNTLRDSQGIGGNISRGGRSDVTAGETACIAAAIQ